MKRLFVLTTLILLMGAILCGCSHKESDNTKTSSSNSVIENLDNKNKDTKDNTKTDTDYDSQSEKKSDNKSHVIEKDANNSSDNTTTKKQKSEDTEPDNSLNNRVEDKKESLRESESKFFKKENPTSLPTQSDEYYEAEIDFSDLE